MLVLWGRLTCAVVTVRFPLCPTESITDSIFRFQDSFCPISSNDFRDIVGVIEYVFTLPYSCQLNFENWNFSSIFFLLLFVGQNLLFEFGCLKFKNWKSDFCF